MLLWLMTSKVVDIRVLKPWDTLKLLWVHVEHTEKVIRVSQETDNYQGRRLYGDKKRVVKESMIIAELLIVVIEGHESKDDASCEARD